MKKINLIKSLALLMVGSILTLSSCDKDDNNGDDPIDFKEVGYYIKGSATGDKDIILGAKQMVEPSSDFATKVPREGMWYGIEYLSAGSFSFLEVTDDAENALGANDVAEVTQDAEAGEAFTYDAGTLVSGGTDAYTVKEEGLYYIMLDKSTMKFWVMQIKNMEINVTGDKAVRVSGSADAATFEVKGVELRAAFKIRFNTAWKFVLEDIAWNESDKAGFADDHVRPVISYGGSTDALTADGGDIKIETDKLLDFSFNWKSGEKGIEGLKIVTTEGGELPPPAFPENLYMTGNATITGDWGWDDGKYISLIPVNGMPHLFYSVQWLETGTDIGFKFSPELEWGPAFGIDAAAGETNGVFDKGNDNVSVTVSGYYTIVVNLESNKIEVNAPNIHGIGDAFGGWDSAQPATLFTVDNVAKTITSPALAADGNVRMHVTAPTMADADGNVVDWWRAEFNVIDGKIEYRGNGGDQAAVPGTSGQIVTLDFVAGTGTIQ